MSRLTRSARERRERWLAIAKIAGVVVITIGLGVVAAVTRPEPTDPVSLCAVNQRIRAHTTLLVDKTDFPTPAHIAGLVRGVARLKQEMRPNEMLSIRIVGASEQDAAKPVFQRCNPPDGRAVSRLWGNPDLLQEQWQASFGQPLKEVLERELMVQTETKSSAIFEAIDVTLWDSGFGADIPERRLILVSDLMQHMPGHSHYDKVPKVDEFLASPIGKRLKTKVWTGLKIDLVYLPDLRAPHLQGDRHIKFWSEVLRRLGTNDVRVLPPFDGTQGPRKVSAR
jgi:hypothetical protein